MESLATGVFMGSAAGSETTAAALGKAGVLRRDPFAMLPFCGYHMGDYLLHWLSMALRTNPAKLPKVFFVNWFRKTAEGKWLWPGYGDNSRVLKWICQRIEGTAKAVETPIGILPTPDAIDLSGSTVTPADMQELLRVDKAGWLNEIASIEQSYTAYGTKLPYALRAELESLKARLAKA